MMKGNELFIRCPFCSAGLKFTPKPGAEPKNLKCPNCHQLQPFSAYKAYSPNAAPKPGYPTGGDTDTQLPGFGAMAGSVQRIGRIKLLDGNKLFQLRIGRNVIGRKAASSQADIQIDTGEGRGMSREHIVILVDTSMGAGYAHKLSLFKKQVNDTFVDGQKLFYGDTLLLKHGMTIKLPDAVLMFDMPDSDATSLI